MIYDCYMTYVLYDTRITKLIFEISFDSYFCKRRNKLRETHPSIAIKLFDLRTRVTSILRT